MDTSASLSKRECSTSSSTPRYVVVMVVVVVVVVAVAVAVAGLRVSRVVGGRVEVARSA